jgi:hypothetical protein
MMSGMTGSRFWKPLIVLLVATPVFLFVGLASTGMGHGNYFFTKLLFPFTMLLAVLAGSIKPPLMWLALAQYPLYGVILGFANKRGRLRRVASIVTVVHALSAVICLIVAGENWS